jgi:hypothetical protein
MAVVSVHQLEERLHRSECWAASENLGRLRDGEDRKTPPKPPVKITYYVVTNPRAFEDHFLELIMQKQASIEETENPGRKAAETPKLQRRLKDVSEALKRSGSYQTRIENIGACWDSRLVDLIEIPVIDSMMTDGTHFAGQTAPILVFRVYDKEVMSHEEGGGVPAIKNQGWAEAVTGADLEYLTRRGAYVKEGPPALMRLDNLLIEALEGTDMTAAEKSLRNREVNKCLKSVRNVAENVILTWCEMQARIKGGEFKVPKGVWYLDYAKEHGLLSESDFSQAHSYIFSGNAAIHYNFMAYTTLNAILALDWLKDFVDRTLGWHRMPKSRENGTCFSDAYEHTTGEVEYATRRAILDQHQAQKRKEAENKWYKKKIELKRGVPKVENIEINAELGAIIREQKKDFLLKDDVMEAAITVVQKVEDEVVHKSGAKGREEVFNKSDVLFIDAVRFWRNERQAGRPDSYTSRDAIRAAMFAYSLFYLSKESEADKLGERTPFDDLDTNWLIAVKKKGMTHTRLRKYQFKELEAGLAHELAVVTKVAVDYFGEYLPAHRLEEHAPA